MKKILITGSAGFIGYNLAKNLIQNKEAKVLGVDSLNNAYDNNLKKLSTFGMNKKGGNLDAFIEEPLPSENELWDLENVIISPHDSATCKDNDNRVIKIFEENMNNLANSKTLDNIVFKSNNTSL